MGFSTPSQDKEVKSLEDEEKILWAIVLVFTALLVGLIVHVWMVSAGIPSFIAAPIGVVAFFVVIAALFGIVGVVIAAIEAIRDFLS